MKIIYATIKKTLRPYLHDMCSISITFLHEKLRLYTNG